MKYLILLSFILTSCFRPSQNFDAKILNQVSTPISHFDPQMSTGLASSVQLGKVYETLLETHPFDGPYKVMPSLAVELPKISKDQKVYTFKIRKNVLYHPCQCFKGLKRAVKAKDFVTSFKRIADPKLNSPHYGFWKKQILGMDKWYTKNGLNKKTDYELPLEGVKAISDYELQITIKSPDLYFVNALTTTNIAPIPMEAVIFFKNDLSNNIVGTGAFVLDRYIRKSRIEYSRNMNYRVKTFPKSSQEKFKPFIQEYGGKQIPFLQKIIVHIINESNTQWLSFMRGKLDYLEIPKDNFSQAITPKKSLSSEMHDKGMVLGVTPSTTNVYYLGFNNKNAVFKNVHLRRAIAYAFDQNKYNELFFNGTATIANTLLPPNILGNTPAKTSPYIGSKIDLAKKELALAGYPNGKGLEQITLTVKNTTLARQIAEFFVKEMSKIGIRAKFETISWGKLLDKANKGSYQIIYLAWFVGLPTGFEFFNLLYGPNWPGSYNRMGHTNKIFDQLYDQARDSTNVDTHKIKFRKMNQIALDNVPLLPLVHAKDFFLRQGWLKNYVPTELAGGLEQYYDIDLKLKKKYLSKF